jgi:hypothetical protein
VLPSTNTSYFNINVGNKWVYKRYNFNVVTGQYNGQTNTIDSVFVNGDTLINTNLYKKVIHRVYNDVVNNPTNFNEHFEFLRIDSNDHLINEFGRVIHPGFDNQYQYTHTYSNSVNNVNIVYGTAIFQLVSPQNILIEGQTYNVNDFKGIFTGNSGLNVPNNIINYMFEEQTGMILSRCPTVSGTSYYEDRLIYYELN